MQTRSLVLAAADGTPLFLRIHRPALANARRTLILIHGAGQHGGRYDHLAAEASARGWTVVAVDLRGHGRSGGVPTHLDRFEDYLSDLDVILNHLQLDDRRTALLGHSLGGLVSVRFVQTRRPQLGALVLSSPLLALRVEVTQLKRAVGRLCALIAPRTRFRTGVREADLTTNAHALQQRREDPLSRRSVTAGWYFEVLDAVCEAWQATDALSLPLLLLQGDADQIVDPEAPYRWLPRVASTDKTLQVLTDQLHELFNEPDWHITADEVLNWLERRISAPAAATAPPQILRARLPGGVTARAA